MVQDLALQTASDKSHFYLDVLSPKKSDTNQWLEDFNEDGSHDVRDLEIQKETIRRIWDQDKDGQADHSQSFAEGFNDLLGGVAGGVLAHDGNIYVTANPSLWVMTRKFLNCFWFKKGYATIFPFKKNNLHKNSQIMYI